MKNVVIIGGGISGLATAYYLRQYAPPTVQITLIESAPRLGGKIASVYDHGFIVECGPDSFITQKTAALSLCRDLGLGDELIGSSNAAKTTYVWNREHLHSIPEGMMLMAPTMILPFLRSSLISWPGKVRMGMETFLPARREESDESLASFVRRRLGKEALEKIAAPLMAGIFSADPEKLSLQSTFPMFLKMERQYGSLTRSILHKKRAQQCASVLPGPRPLPPSMFMTLRGGLQQLVDTLVQRLHRETILLNRGVCSVVRDRNRYKIELSDGSPLWADEIVFATPANITAELLWDVDPVLAIKLRAIRYVSTATVSLGFRRGHIQHPMKGSGFLVPHSEKRRINACSWSSKKFSHRAPDDCELIRVFVGGARAEALAEQDDAALIDLARQELRITMGITALPVLAKAYRWPNANPQYDVGHGTRMDEIDEIVAWHHGLHLAGAAYRGAGIPDCIQNAMKTALAISRNLASSDATFKATRSVVSV